MSKKEAAPKKTQLGRDAIVGLLLEQFLNQGFGSIRSMCQQAYIYGQQEAYARGLKEGRKLAQDSKGGERCCDNGFFGKKHRCQKQCAVQSGAEGKKEGGK